MKTFLRLSMILVAWVLALVLTGGSAALAQVGSFPYSQQFEYGAQNPIWADSNWSSATSNFNSPSPWAELTSGGQAGSGAAYLAAWSASNKYSRLLLTLNTPSFSAGEYIQYYIKRDGTQMDSANTYVDISIEYSTDGTNFTTIDGPLALGTYVPTANVWQSQVHFLPGSLGGRSNLYLAITVKSQSGLKSKFDNIYVDDFFIGGGALPIQLASSAAYVIRDNDVEVAWKTVSETNNYGFEVYRKRGETGDWTKIGFVQGHGTSLAPQSYSYIDRSLSFGKYNYRIKQIDLDGQSKDYPAMDVTVGTADKFVLAQNYPNPFNPSTMVEFAVPQSGFATMKVYNVLGQEVATLFEENADAGKVYTVRFSAIGGSAFGGNASSLPSGLYFYTLKSAGKTDTKRMLLLK